MGKLQELGEELRGVFSGRGARLLDSFLPPVVFLLVNSLSNVNLALWAALGISGVFAAYRIMQKENLTYALGGLGGTLLAALFVKLSGSGAGFFLPGFFSGAATVILCVVSVAFNRPLVAWSSYITRRWALNWYWHPQVLPAYNEVTILWAVAFAARLTFEFWLYQQDALGALGTVRILLGWPFIVVLLIVSYIYGLWRLAKLQGPSVDEFKAGKAPPWEGQKRGF
ncbi:MAG: DUF3159 domain-containing protein [Anaerolineales bacterium]|nr:DUF3159 domain-containing protein [Anaerolineales bacterium]